MVQTITTLFEEELMKIRSKPMFDSFEPPAMAHILSKVHCYVNANHGMVHEFFKMQTMGKLTLYSSRSHQLSQLLTAENKNKMIASRWNELLSRWKQSITNHATIKLLMNFSTPFNQPSKYLLRQIFSTIHLLTSSPSLMFITGRSLPLKKKKIVTSWIKNRIATMSPLM